MDLVTDPDLAERILDIPYRYHLAAAKRLVEMGVDMIWIGDDVGTQRGMLISPDTWRRFLKPRMAELVSRVKAINPPLKVAYHSDGDMRDHPRPDRDRPRRAEPDPAGLHGSGRAEAPVRRPALLLGHHRRAAHAALRHAGGRRRRGPPRLETIGQGGGLIIGPTHHVQLDTPLENFWAMVDTIRDTPCQ